MIVLQQRDKRWAELKLGASNVTVGDKGCTTTDISMLSDYFGVYKNPGELALHKELYDAQGRIIWPILNTIFDSRFQWNWRQYGYMPAKIDDSIKDPKKGVILELNDGAHWVEALKKIMPGVYYVSDPWDGKKKINLRKITGSSHFISK